MAFRSLGSATHAYRQMSEIILPIMLMMPLLLRCIHFTFYKALWLE
jgi:hypothetical protein